MPALQPERISRYTITNELGKGSMGVVYEGRPDDGGPEVAIKVFYPDPQLTPEETSTLLTRFEREGAALRRLNHPNVVSVLEVGTTDSLEYIVMEKLSGMNLRELLALGTRFTLGDTLDIMHQLLQGLAACHRLGIVHRDVKPANLVRAADGVIKLTDFGIARIITDQTLSRSGTIVGTPNYMSPEQIRGEEVDPRTDLFSAGVLMYELLTGKKPFDAPDVTAIMYNVTTVHPPSPRFYNGALPVDIEEIIFKAVAKAARDRYTTSEDFARALRDFEQELHVRDDTEAVLNALPSAPDQDAIIASGGAPVARANPLGQASSGALTSASMALTGGGLIAGKVYCIDCGLQNDMQSEFCLRCMRPLVKRDLIQQLAQQHAKLVHKVNRGDYLFLTCLSIVIVIALVLILWLFFKAALPG